MERDEIDISGLSKAALLAALYNRSKPQGMGFLHYDSTPMSEVEAQALLDAQVPEPDGSTPRFDYVKGRVMKVNISGDGLYPGLYDRDNGAGAAAEVIQGLRRA